MKCPPSCYIVLLFVSFCPFLAALPVSASQNVTNSSNSPNRSQSSPPPDPQWDTLLYDKEIGTWCEPAAEPMAPIAASMELQNREQRLSPASSSSRSVTEIDSVTLTRWVDAALRVVRSQTLAANCSDEPWCVQDEQSTLTTEKQLLLSRPVPSNMNLYVAVAEKHHQHKLDAVLPDGALTKTGAHDAWIVLDPTPHLAFGHTLYVFVVDYNTSDVNCIAAGGIPLDGEECINQVFKNRCPNRMVRRAANWRHKGPHRCDVDFLPLVHYHSKAPSQNDQRLMCNSDVKGFAPCPQLRSWNETSELICDPLSSNHKRCDSTQDVVKTRCRLFETCDQAVLLSGGWNWQWSGEREVLRLLAMYRMFRHNGFDKQSVKIFFANGARARRGHDPAEEFQPESSVPSAASGMADPFSFSAAKEDAGQKAAPVRHEQHHHRQMSERPAMYPAALKIGMRNHIRTMCTTPHCTDSLVIYLSSPTRADGASLLWDADNNGEFDETEVYTIREFLRDIQDCVARQVVVLVDQNHSGLLADSLRRSKRHPNVLMFTSGQSQQLSMVGEFTHHWANYHHGHSCLSQAFKDSAEAIRFSTTRFEDSSNGTLAYNLFGAPCDAVPPYSSYELKSLYMGCQYVPTRLWLSRPGSDTDPPPRLGRRR